MATAFDDLMSVGERAGTFSAADERAWALIPCSNCGGTQTAVIAYTFRSADIRWLRCVNCKQGMVENYGAISPETKPLRVPAGLPGAELAAWKEVRECLAVGAHTAAVMLCRKLLLHVAVRHGLPAKDERGWAPSYQAAVTHLEEEGLITKLMRPWVDRIKDVGNEANHEIQPVNADVALDVATFTEQLLRLAYEMKVLMGEESTPESGLS